MKHIRDIAKNFQMPPIGEPEPIAPVCQTCKGMGQLEGYDSQTGETRIVMCPHCEKGQGFLRKVREAMVKQSGLPQQYMDANLKTWSADLGMTEQNNKLMAFWATSDFALYRSVSSHRLAERAFGYYQQFDPSSPLLPVMQEKLNEPDLTVPGLVLYGDYGVGKTWLAAAATNYLLLRGHKVLYMRMADILTMLMDTWRSSEQTMEVLNRFRHADILFIDDMNSKARDDEPLPPHQQEYATMMIRYRMANRLPTIITTNFFPDFFTLKWGPEASDVLLEGAHWIKVGGVELRKTKKTLWE